MDHVSTHDHGNSVVVPTADRPPVNAPRAAVPVSRERDGRHDS